jgi:N-acetylglucosaminyl-diphospho-decaprenol L-rhamnosyltransferase
VKISIVTAARGRTEHLRRQLAGVQRSATQVHRHIIVAIDDDEVEQTARSSPLRTEVVALQSSTPTIPMAAARNLGARTAIDDGADLLVFLDVDCIPAPAMVGRYAAAARDAAHRDALLCGPVTYLPPAGPDGYPMDRLAELIDPHPARPVLGDYDISVTTDYQLFWSLSFAVTPDTWRRVGGFCTDYTGYGGEDTDFAQQAAAQSVTMRWVGGAHAFHQFHPVSDPPIEHLADIVANANVFHRRWGWWPMPGWLDAFEALGAITRDDAGQPTINPPYIARGSEDGASSSTDPRSSSSDDR